MQKLFIGGLLLAVKIDAESMETEFAIALTNCVNKSGEDLQPTSWDAYWMTFETQAAIKAGCQSLKPALRDVCTGNIDNVKLISQNYASVVNDPACYLSN